MDSQLLKDIKTAIKHDSPYTELFKRVLCELSETTKTATPENTNVSAGDSGAGSHNPDNNGVSRTDGLIGWDAVAADEEKYRKQHPDDERTLVEIADDGDWQRWHDNDEQPIL